MFKSCVKLCTKSNQIRALLTLLVEIMDFWAKVKNGLCFGEDPKLRPFREPFESYYLFEKLRAAYTTIKVLI